MRFKHFALLSLIAFSRLWASGQSANEALKTTAEKTDYVETGRYTEVETLCHEFEKSFGSRVKCFSIGVSPQGRAIYVLAASNDGTITAEVARQRNRPVVLAQGGIHAGEIDGKDAGFRFLRDLLENKVVPDALSKVTFLFVPVFNVDGHERFGPFNRPNQNGPKEMGFRTTAQNLNLNRDYMKADAPEMRAMLAFLSQWDPAVYVDLHATDGAQFQHDIAILVEPTRSYDERLQELGRRLQAHILSDLSAHGSKPLDFYPSFIDENDPLKGVSAYVTAPRFSQGYWGLRGRFGVLVETHSWKDYKTRVQITYNTLESIIDQATKDGTNWLQEFHRSETRESSLGGKTVPLTFKKTNAVKWLDFQGYAFSRSMSSIAGDIVIKYDPSKPNIWHMPLYASVVPDLSVIAPKGGYVIPMEWADLLAPKLKLHGIRYKVLERDSHQQIEIFKASEVKWPKSSYEGRMPVVIQGDWSGTTSNIAKGSLFVPIAQPRRMVLNLFEPKAPDSFAAWGDFNSVFERKEYMEAYVAQSIAEEMLSKDKAIKAEFEEKLRSDPKFKADPKARLDFFYMHHPSWDKHFNIYPILRVERAL